MDKIYRKNFKKTVWGWIEIKAKDKAEAEEKFDRSDWYDEIDNKSDYEWENGWQE